MYSLVFPKIVYQTLHIENVEEDYRECIHLFSEIFSYKTIHIHNFEEDNRECIQLFSERFTMKQYRSKILKNIIETVFTCFTKYSLSNNTYPIFLEDKRECVYLFSRSWRKILYQTIHVQNFQEDNREHIHLFSEKLSIKQDICKILKNVIESVFICFCGKFSMKQYVSKILKKIIQNVL